MWLNEVKYKDAIHIGLTDPYWANIFLYFRFQYDVMYDKSYLL